MVRRVLTLGLVLAAIWGIAPGVAEEGPKKWALIIGVSDYDEEEEIIDLAESEASARMMAALLEDRFSFDQVELITGVDADYRTISAALKSFADQPYGKDDVVVFFYSGHGSFLPDDGNDEPDGVDETICPKDTERMEKADFSLTADKFPDLNQIRDDELNRVFTKVSSKTDNLTVILDSCHSGSGTRDVRKKMTFSNSPDASAALEQFKAERGVSKSSTSTSGLSDEMEVRNINWTAISACGAGEVAVLLPGEDVSALTKYLVRELELATPKTDYSELIERIRAGLRTETHLPQHPTLEQAKPHYVFGGEAPDQPVYYLVQKDLELNAGEAHGVNPGSVFEVYPPGTSWSGDQPSKKPIGQYSVQKVGPLKTALSPTSGAPQSVPNAARALMIVRGYDEFADKVCLAPEAQSLAPAVKSASHLQLVSDRKEADWYIGKNDEKTSVFSVVGPDYESNKDVPTRAEDEIEQLVLDLNKVVRFHHILSLEDQTKGDAGTVDFSMRVLAGQQEVKPDADGVYHLKAGQPLRVAVRNESEQDIHLNAVFLNSGTTTNKKTKETASHVVQPMNKDSDTELKVTSPKGEFYFGEGEAGDSIYVKLIATSEPAEFGVLRQKGIRTAAYSADRSGSRGPTSELTHLLSAAAQGKYRSRRGGKKPSVDVGSWKSRTINVVYE